MLTMDDRYLQVWREQARELGLPGPAIDQWIGLARPQLALHVVTDDPGAADAPIVGYRGGHPSLPAEIEWPGTPNFIASIDCAALPHDLPGLPLPKDGHLLFFANNEYFGPECECPDNDGRVLHVPAGTATSERVITTSIQPEVEPGQFPLQCSPYWDPPHGCCGLIPDDFDELMRVLKDPRPAYVRDLNVEMLLGGYCFTNRSDPCEDAAYSDPEHEKWRQLAHMDRDLIMQGEPLPFYVRWIIREDDLAGQRFDRVKTYTEDLFA
jgi:hypothetical protein